jgi:hypothetical protein
MDLEQVTFKENSQLFYIDEINFTSGSTLSAEYIMFTSDQNLIGTSIEITKEDAPYLRKDVILIRGKL